MIITIVLPDNPVFSGSEINANFYSVTSPGNIKYTFNDNGKCIIENHKGQTSELQFAVNSKAWANRDVLTCIVNLTLYNDVPITCTECSKDEENEFRTLLDQMRKEIDNLPSKVEIQLESDVFNI